MSFPSDQQWTETEGRVAAVPRRAGDVEGGVLGPTTMHFIAGADLTQGRYGLFRWDMRPGSGGAGAHFHRTFSESFFILDGTVNLYDGDGWAPFGAGDFLYVPEGGIHGFALEGDAPASMLILFSPAPPRELYFRELEAIVAEGRQLSGEEWVELWARHDQFPA